MHMIMFCRRRGRGRKTSHNLSLSSKNKSILTQKDYEEGFKKMGGGEAAREEFHMNWCMISPSSPGSDNQRTGGRKGKSCHQASLLNTILVGTRKS